jgi:hypothetical protein
LNNGFGKTNTKENPSFVQEIEKNAAKPFYESYQVKNKVIKGVDSNPCDLF